MSRMFFPLGGVVAACLIPVGLAWAADDPLAERIERLVSGVKPGTMRIGVHVVDLQTGLPVYARNADEPLKPASNMKLLTVAAAMDLLPPTFTYRTVLALRGDDLVVLGAGDPSLGDPRLAKERKEPITAVFHDWAAKLKEKGVTEIKGRLIIDDSIFESAFYHPNWPADQRQHWFSAPVGGLNFNNNCIDVAIKPGEKPGDPALIEVIPPNTYTSIRNECKTAAKGAASNATISRKGDQPLYVVSGTCRSAGILQSVAVPDPGLFFAGACRTALAAKGIKIHGETVRERVRDDRGNLPATCTPVAVYERPLNDLLGRINKNSQNLFAECLLKTLGFHLSAAETGRGIGSYETGRKHVNAFLDKCQAPRVAGVYIDDGSGFSARNRVTARMITHVLRYMARHPRKQDYRGSLAEPGDEGTLKDRMRDLKGRVQAKTGYISGVYALSGYARGESGRTYCFSILINNVTAGQPKSLQDDICRALVNDVSDKTTRPASARARR